MEEFWAHSSWQNCCNSATLEGFRARTAFLRSCHSISMGIQVRTLTRPLQSLHFVFLQPFIGGFAGVFWIIVLLQNPVRFSLRSQADGRTFFGRHQNSWFHLSQQVFQVLKQQNSPRPSHYHHHILLLV